MKKWLIAVVALVVLLLVACGGQSGLEWNLFGTERTYFVECPELETPDCILNGVTLHSNDGKIYAYLLDERIDKAEKSFAQWLEHLERKGYTFSDYEQMTVVEKDGKMIGITKFSQSTEGNVLLMGFK